MADQEVSLELKVIKSGLENIEALIKELGGASVETGKFQAQANDLGSALDRLAEQQKLVSAFIKLKQETVAAESAMQEAKAEAADLAKELKATEAPTKAQVAAFEKARRAAKGAEEAFTEQRASLQQLRGKLNDAGVSTTDLAATQVNLNKTQKELAVEGAALVKSLTATKAAQDTLADSAEKTGYSVEQAMAKVGIRRHAEIEAEINEVRKAYKALADSGELTERELAQANLKTQESIRSLKTETNGWMQSLDKMKFELAAAGTALYGIGSFFAGAAKESATFGAKMAEVSTLLDDTSSVDGMKDAVRQLSLEYGGDVNANAQALYDIISAGASDSATATEQLRVANQLAMGGMTDVNIAADGLTSALNAYGDAAGGAANVSDAFFTAVKAGKTTVGELSGSIGTVAPMAKTAGVSLDELLASVAALTAGGVSTRESMTQMKGALTSIIKPSKEALDLATELGIEFNVAALQTKGWAGFLDEVKTATGGNVESMGKLFGSVEGLNAVLTLTGEGSQKFGEIMEAMGKKTGATAEAVEKMMDTPAVRGARFNAAMVDIRNSIGDAVTAFSPFLEGLTELINKFNQLDGDTKMVVAGFGAVAVALPPIFIAMKSLAQAYEILKAATVFATTATTVNAAATAGSAIATTAATAATTAFGAAMRALPLLYAAERMSAMATAAWEWKEAADQADEAETRLARTLAEQEDLYARLSEETGAAITSMQEFTQAKRDGIVVFDEAAGKWIAAAQAQAVLAEETAKATEEERRQAEWTEKHSALVGTQAKAIVDASLATSKWADSLGAIDPAAEGAAKAVTDLVGKLDLGDSVQVAGFITALEQVKATSTEAGAVVEKELIDRVKALDNQKLNAFMLTLKAAFEQGTISAEQFAARAEEVTRAAAQQMGIDIEQSLGKTTSATTNALASIGTLAEGMKATGRTTVEQTTIMAAALEKAFDGVKTKGDIDALNAKLKELGQQGLLTSSQISTLQAASAEAAAAISTVANASSYTAGKLAISTSNMSASLLSAGTSADHLRDRVTGIGNAADEAADKMRRLKEETDAAATASQGMSAALGNMLGKGRAEFEQFGEAAVEAYDRLVESHTRMSQNVGVDTYLRTLTQQVDTLRKSYEGLNSSSLENVNGQLKTMNDNLRETEGYF